MACIGRRFLDKQGGLVSGKGKVMEKTVTEKREVEKNVSEGIE